MPSILKSLKLLSDPTRLRLVNLLHHERLSVADLQELLGMAQSRISTQLSQLKGEGLVNDERSGKHNIYELKLTGELLQLARSAGAELPETTNDLKALRHFQRKRKDRARAYFDELAGKFGKAYVPGRSWKGLAEGLLKLHRYGVVVDLGAGEGTLAQLMASRAEQVIAVDHSEEMVKFGQDLAKRHELKNLEFRQGDIEDPPIKPETVDLACLSQALHHAQSPERALRAAYAMLKPGGQLMVLDLVQHQFEEARELYADVWLGFSEAELAEMMEAVGFTEVSTAVVDREEEAPHFQTLLATGVRSQGA